MLKRIRSRHELPEESFGEESGAPHKRDVLFVVGPMPRDSVFLTKYLYRIVDSKRACRFFSSLLFFFILWGKILNEEILYHPT